MKSIFTVLICLCVSISSFAQLAGFEETPLAQDTFWNGIDQTGSFTSGDIFYFPNVYNTNFGGYWQSGWALSSMADSTTSGPGNLYAAKALTGYQSNQYAVGQQNSIIKLEDASYGFQELYITNTTYTFNSMRDSDQFAKKFGGEDGNDPDFFKLVIWGYFDGTLSTTDSIEYYLADYRFEDNSQDYKVDSWELLDLTTLEQADSLLFTLSSSDTTNGFYNTPLFFCIDNLQASLPVSTSELSTANTSIKLSPNPATDFLQVNFDKSYSQLTVDVLDARGATIFSKSILNQDQARLDISTLPSGVYFLQVQGKAKFSQKFIKL